MRRVLQGIALFFAFTCLLAASPASAQEETADHVTINGRHLNVIEVFFLERIIGQDIPDGNYWFDVNTGLWGHVGEPAQGHLDLSPEHKQYVVRNMSPHSDPEPALERPVTTQLHAGCDSDCTYW